MHRILLSILLTTSLFAKDVIAVLELEQKGLTKQEAEILTDRLTTELISLDRYRVVERTNMDKILKEQKFQKSGCTDSECAVEIGQLLNTDYIVIGSVSKFGSTWTLDARLIDVGQGNSLISAKFSKEGKIDVLVTTGMLSIAQQLSELSSANSKTSTKEASGSIDKDMVENKSASKQNIINHKKSEKVKGVIAFGLGIFSGSNKVIINEQVKGGLFVSIFGGTKLNLVRAKLNKRRNIIYIFVWMGGSTIIVPKDMYVDTQVMPIFGGFQNKSEFVEENETQSNKKLIIRGLVMFGGGSVRNETWMDNIGKWQ